MNNFRDSGKTYSFEPIKGELGIKLVSPRKVLLYWDVTASPLKVIEQFFNCGEEDMMYVLRIYDATDREFDGRNSHYYHEVVIPYQNGHWYIKGLLTNRSYIAELGVNLTGHGFFPVLRSHPVYTPMMKIPAKGMQHGLSMIYQIENSKPKWKDLVSTYSYYEKPRLEEKNE